MTEEIYKNGDIYWNTYSGKFKMFDKDGNEIPYECSELITKRLEQERDGLKKACEKCKLFDIEKTNRDLLERIDKLEQENKELKEIINKSAKNFCNDYLKTFEENKMLNKHIIEVKFNAQQEIEFLTEEKNNYRSALEEILEIARADCKRCTAECDCDNDCTRYKIKNKINEVLG